MFGWFDVVNNNSNFLFLSIGFGDFLVYYVIVLGLYMIIFILVKGVLDVWGFKLMFDKKEFGYSFFCDGLGWGGICDILVWDVFYLVVFWMLNIIGWVIFYWYWKYIILW